MFTLTRHFNQSFVNTIDLDETYHGHWWLPSNPQNRISGVLYLKRKGGISLTLIGMFQDDASDSIGHNLVEHDIILGELVPGSGPVTLLCCKERQRESPYINNTSKGAVQRFIAGHFLFNYHASDIKSLKFSYFEFSTTYLVDWVDSKQLDFKFQGNSSIVTSLPNTNLVVHGKGYEIKITSWASTSMGGSYNSSQHSSVSIKLIEGITLGIFDERFKKPLLDLFQFGSSCLNSILFLNATPIEFDKTIKIISSVEFDRINRSIESIKHDALFRLSDFENTWQEFIINWLRFHQKSQYIFGLYFDSFYIGFQFPVSKFLNIIQAIESYHSERNDSQIILTEKDKFFEKKKKALSLVMKDDKQLANWIDTKFSYFTTLRSRLKELIEEASPVLISVLDNNELFVSRVIDSRNYYTHYDTEKRIKAAHGTELEAITGLLRVLLGFNILLECGVSKEKCVELILRYNYYKAIQDIVAENRFWKN
jgi:hypothetical protein